MNCDAVSSSEARETERLMKYNVSIYRSIYYNVFYTVQTVRSEILHRGLVFSMTVVTHEIVFFSKQSLLHAL